MIRNFIAIDFETANQQPSSVCSVGVVMVRNGQVADTFYSLIQPELNYYYYWCQRMHGLSQSDTLQVSHHHTNGATFETFRAFAFYPFRCYVFGATTTSSCTATTSTLFSYCALVLGISANSTLRLSNRTFSSSVIATNP